MSGQEFFCEKTLLESIDCKARGNHTVDTTPRRPRSIHGSIERIPGLLFRSMSSIQQSRQPAFTVYVKQAREYLASHDSSQLRECLAARAEHLYGVPRGLVRVRLLVKKSGRRLRSDSRHLQTDSQERRKDTEQAVGMPPAVVDPEYERLIRQVNADEPVSLISD